MPHPSSQWRFTWPYWRTLALYALLLGIAVLMVFPLLWLVSTSFKGPTENILAAPPQFIPQSPTLANYRQVWQSNPFLQYFLNSTIVAVLTVALNLLLCSLAAYPWPAWPFEDETPSWR